MERNKKIVNLSIAGILVNILLVIFKMTAGVLSNSIAIILDAVNNLSDALSSVITIIGTKIAGKAPDRRHPYGYGRTEYISSAVIAVIILFAGLSALRESVDKIIHPADTRYSFWIILIIAVSAAVKFLFGSYLKKAGNQINAQTLVASGVDSVMDSVVSLGTLASAAASLIWSVNIDGIVGAVISVFILKTGLEILGGTMGSIVGKRIDSDFAAQIKEKINEHDKVCGSYDLILHDYGPNEMLGSVHIEVADETTAKEIDVLTREIVMDVYKELGVLLTIGIYATNTSDSEFLEMKKTIQEEASHYEEILQVHGFYADSNTKRVSFDVVMSFDARNPKQIIDELMNKLSARYSGYSFIIYQDNDYSD